MRWALGNFFSELIYSLPDTYGRRGKPGGLDHLTSRRLYARERWFFSNGDRKRRGDHQEPLRPNKDRTWKLEKGQNDPSGYLHIQNGDQFIGGIPPAQHRNPDTPPHWLAYFEIVNCDLTTATAKQLGARTYLDSMTMKNVGRWSVLADPQGAVFAVFQSILHEQTVKASSQALQRDHRLQH